LKVVSKRSAQQALLDSIFLRFKKIISLSCRLFC
jgi:hypothetical protein